MEERIVSAGTALSDCSNEGQAIFGWCIIEVNCVFQNLRIEKPLHKILIGTGAADIGCFVILDLKNCDWNIAETILERILHLIGDYTQIEQICSAYTFVILRFRRVFIFDQSVDLMHFTDLFKGYWFAVIIALYL